jgi:osmotically-inducible protein OsmY
MIDKPGENSMNKYVSVILVALASGLALSSCAETPTSASTGGYIDDSAITAKVKNAILQDADLKVMQIQVKTFKGTVQLSGFVDTPRMVAHAGTVVKQVNGVVSVKNDLLVK